MSDVGAALAEAIRLRRGGRLDDAWQALVPWLTSPEPEVAEEAALLCDQLGHKARAIAFLERVTTTHPSRAIAWINLAALRAEAGDVGAAAEAARVATRLAPRRVAAWVNLGSALATQRDYAGAIEAFSRAVQLEPADPDLAVDLAAAEFAAGQVGSAARRLQALLSRHPHASRARSLLLFALHHATNDAVGLAHAHAQFGASAGCVASRMPARRRTPDAPLRVGLVSGDFRRHSVWYFLNAILHRAAQQGLELYCYHTDPLRDDITDRWQARAAGFADVSGLDDASLDARMRADDLDVLLSLAGHTTGARPELFLRRIAPVQASFLGYPGPLGSANVDYWIADDRVAPVGEVDGEVYGRIARLPDSYFCFDPEATPPARSALTADAPVVFGSFNILGKISAVTVRLWSDVLKAVPTARLVLKADAMAGPGAERLRREFEDQGISSERLVLAPWCASREQHLERYGHIDIALDTFPYNGATTTCEALWMGVPVVSLAGRTPASRMGRSILRAAGLAAFGTDDAARFIQQAVTLAERVGELRAGRSDWRRRIGASALCDRDRYVSAFAKLLRQLTLT